MYSDATDPMRSSDNNIPTACLRRRVHAALDHQMTTPVGATQLPRKFARNVVSFLPEQQFDFCFLQKI